MQAKMGKIIGTLNKGIKFFFQGITSTVNLKRDLALIMVFFLAMSFLVFVVVSRYRFVPEKTEPLNPETLLMTEEQIYEEVKAVQETIDATNWKVYQTQWYGFKIKYPENWLAPKIQNPTKESSWEYSYQFRKKELAENDLYSGFDVVIYNLAKTKELSETDEFPIFKDESLKGQEACQTIEGHLIETGDYPAEEVYIPPADNCYNPALFFSLVKGQYVYNIIPRPKDFGVISGDPRVELIDNFPEFFTIISTLEIIDIVRPKPVALKPRITAPKPYAATRRDSAGRTVCASKNDHPQKSNKSKGKHLDMECCLDPDEYPNPWCYYDPAKYGKYLK